jgi:hypothetical protein
VAGRRASDTPLVGRERELTLLRGTVDRVQREREPQLLTLVGVPGIAKTRLVSELARDLDRRGDWLWLEGRSLPYGEGATFWAFCEIVRAFTGVLDSDSDERATGKVHGAVAAVVPEPSEVAWLERHLRPLVDIDTDNLGSGDRRGEAFAAWRRLLEALAPVGGGPCTPGCSRSDTSTPRCHPNSAEDRCREASGSWWQRWPGGQRPWSTSRSRSG